MNIFDCSADQSKSSSESRSALLNRLPLRIGQCQDHVGGLLRDHHRRRIRIPYGAGVTLKLRAQWKKDAYRGRTKKMPRPAPHDVVSCEIVSAGAEAP